MQSEEKTKAFPISMIFDAKTNINEKNVESSPPMLKNASALEVRKTGTLIGDENTGARKSSFQPNHTRNVSMFNTTNTRLPSLGKYPGINLD